MKTSVYVASIEALGSVFGVAVQAAVTATASMATRRFLGKDMTHSI